MSAANLSIEVWAVVGLIATLTAIGSLSVLAKFMSELRRAKQLTEDVYRLREAYSATLRGPATVANRVAEAGVDIIEETDQKVAA